MKKLGIRFSDNDFATTFHALLNIMGDQGLDSYPADRKKLTDLINKALPGLYWISQNRGRYETQCDIVSYLKIDTKHIYIDGEVDAFLKERDGWDNGEFHVLDTTVLFNHSYVCSY